MRLLIRRARALPKGSFRFQFAMETLAVLVKYSPGLGDFRPIECDLPVVREGKGYHLRSLEPHELIPAQQPLKRRCWSAAL